MTARPLNMRLTVVIIFAFLFIVALFISPGGAAEQATSQISAVAEKTSGKRPAAVVGAPVRPANPSWFAPEGEQGAMDPAPHSLGGKAEPGLVPGDIPLVDPDPPPQGPDFPENS